ncbi:hypothetical protein GOP47_0023190, partial [Adiantum capillus-veneris]
TRAATSRESPCVGVREEGRRRADHGSHSEGSHLQKPIKGGSTKQNCTQAGASEQEGSTLSTTKGVRRAPRVQDLQGVMIKSEVPREVKEIRATGGKRAAMLHPEAKIRE